MNSTALFTTNDTDKRARFFQELQDLTIHHQTHCSDYRRMTKNVFGHSQSKTLEEAPYLPVRLFKSLELKSVPQTGVVKTLMSSGTSSQTPSRIFLDADTARKQSLGLASIFTNFFGQGRRSMFIIDSGEFLKNRAAFNARGAAILGFSTFGREPFYGLDENLNLRKDAILEYFSTKSDKPIFLFGFTFMVWHNLVVALRRENISIKLHPDSFLVHGGGWKKMVDQKVSREEFKIGLRETLGLHRVNDYYGLVEQVGTIFLECEHSRLHVPDDAYVNIRDPQSYAVLSKKSKGLLQCMSLLPRSYPGHSILTEDLAQVSGVDDCPCGRLGQTVEIFGRLPQAEARGCSDTRVTP